MLRKSIGSGTVLFVFLLLLSAPACKSFSDNKTGDIAFTKQIIEQQQILKVMYRFSYMFDGKDPDGFANLFTEDAVFEMWALDDKKPQLSVKTREKIRAYAAERFKTDLVGHETRYFQTNPIFLEMTETMARTTTMVIGTHFIRGGKEIKVLASGSYQDEFKKTQEGWKIHHRIVKLDIPL